MTKLILFFTFVLFVSGQAGAAEPGEAELQAAYWKAAAKASAAQGALRGSMSDAQKQMEAQRDGFGREAETARVKMAAVCEAKKQVLDVDAFECKASPVAATPSVAPEVKK